MDLLSRLNDAVNNLTLVCVTNITCDNGYYWTEVHILRLVLLEEIARVTDYRLVVGNHIPDYNPEENLKNNRLK